MLIWLVFEDSIFYGMGFFMVNEVFGVVLLSFGLNLGFVMGKIFFMLLWFYFLDLGVGGLV